MIARALAILTAALVLTFNSLSAANAQLVSAGGYLSALGQARVSAATTAVLPSTSTSPQADLGLFALMVGFALVVALFALARRQQAR